MKHLTAYSTVVGELPKMCKDGNPLVLVPLNEVRDLVKNIEQIIEDKTHTDYQNKCYLSFLLRGVGLK